MTVLEEVAAERRRQIEVEGWSASHDDTHHRGEMAIAACCYATPDLLYKYRSRAEAFIFSDPWPWADKWDKRPHNENIILPNFTAEPSLRRTLLVKAAALIVAEIERLDREVVNDTKFTWSK